MDYKLSVTDVADDSVQAAIRAPLVAYNQDKAGTSDYRALVVTLTDLEGKVIGGLWGRTAYSWLFVELLFVPEHLRGRGLGKTLLQQAEVIYLVSAAASRPSKRPRSGVAAMRGSTLTSFRPADFTSTWVTDASESCRTTRRASHATF